MNEFLPFSTFNLCHRYTGVKTTVLLTLIFAVLLSLFFQVRIDIIQ